MTRIWYKVIKNVSQIYNIEVKAKTNLLILKKLKMKCAKFITETVIICPLNVRIVFADIGFIKKSVCRFG